MKQFTASTKASDIKRTWHLIDVKDEVLGRIGTKIALMLMGKSKPYFVASLDCGDYVVVINAAKVRVTGKKAEQKIYDRFSGYPGGRTAKTYSQVMKMDPTRIVTEAVSGMLPNNKLRDAMMKRLYVFPDEKHTYGDKIKNQNANSKKTE